MHQLCEVSAFSAVLLAVAQEEMPQSQIPNRIRGLFDVVYSWVRTAPVRQVGRNYAIYEKGSGTNLLVRAGFPVSESFADMESVKCLELSACSVAHIAHIGPYSDLRQSYAALES
jgi:effector-binding domain-containing protein